MREMAEFPPCFHLVGDKEFSSYSGLSFGLASNSIFSDGIFLTFSLKVLLIFIDIIKPKCLILLMDP